MRHSWLDSGNSDIIPAGHKYLKSYNLSLENHVVRTCMKIKLALI